MDVMHGGGDARDTCRVTLLGQHAATRAEARDPPTQTENIDPHRKEHANMSTCTTSDVQRVGGWEREQREGGDGRQAESPGLIAPMNET